MRVLKNNYIFGEQSGKLFVLKKEEDSNWQNLSESEVDIDLAETITEDYAPNVVKGLLLEQYEGDIDFWKQRLSEAHSEEQLKQLLKTKLGCLTTNSDGKIEDLFEADGSSLTKEAVKKLENIASGKTKVRILHTELLSKTWKTIRGANAAIRALEEPLGAYLFAYLPSGKIVEGGTNNLKEYQIDLKGLNSTEIHKRIASALNALKGITDIEINNLPLKGDGEAVIVTFGRKTSPADLAKVQQKFRDKFTETPPKNATGIKKFVTIMQKAIKNFKDIFTKNQGKDVTTESLKDFKFINPTDIEMFYSQEEIDLAREALQTFAKIKVTSKRGGFGSTAFGRKINKIYKEDPAKLEALKAAFKELGKEWNQESASTLLSAVADILSTSKWKNKEELGRVLRQINLIEGQLKHDYYTINS